MLKNKNRPIWLEANLDKDKDKVINIFDGSENTLFGGVMEGNGTHIINIPDREQKNIIEEIHQKIDDAFSQLDIIDDDRLLVLLSALLIEHAIENLLKAIFPGFKATVENRDMTFSMKIQVTKAMNLISTKVLNNADFIRGIRNDFVHKIEIKSFENIKAKKLSSLQDRFKNYKPRGVSDSEFDAYINQCSTSELYKNFTYITVAAIDYFSIEAGLFSEFLRDKEMYVNKYQEFINKKYS